MSTVPTIGFNVEAVETGAGLQFTVWDVGGQSKMQSLWHHYYDNVDGMLFVVDSTDEMRLIEAGTALNEILSDVQMNGVPVVVLANKQDMPNAVEPGRLVETLGLLKMAQRPWHVRGTCATSGAGLYEGLFELAEMIKQRRKPRVSN
uniref:Uncharacterized protein n=1 Tax=Plectus sambesii TaxID=2011161 RepID=A0A914WN99_9BILA